MISYSVPKHIRYAAYLGIFFSAVFIHELVISSLSSGPLRNSPSVQSLSAVTIAGVLFYAFEKFLWKVPDFLGFPIVPNFSGRWHGYITRRRSFERLADQPSHFTEKTEHFIPVLVTIDQNFSDLSISLKSYNPNLNLERPTVLAAEASECRVASVDTSSPRRPKLRYAFGVKLSGLPDIEGYSEMTMTDVKGFSSLYGTYFSNRRRLADMELHRAQHSQPTLYNGIIRGFPNNSSAEYIGVEIPNDAILPFSRQFLATVGKRRYDALCGGRLDRDNNDAHHLTLIAPDECAALSTENIDIVKGFLGQTIWIECRYLGRVEAGTSLAYYIISACPFGEMLRERVGLRHLDFHITLGLEGSDIHGVPKDTKTRVRAIPFQRLRLLKGRPTSHGVDPRMGKRRS